MKISEARKFLRGAASNAGDTGQYNDYQLDMAVQVIGDDLARRTGATVTATAVTLADGDEDVPAVHADFRPELLRGAPWLEGSGVTCPRGSDAAELDVISAATLAAMLAGDTEEGQPEVIAWRSPADPGRVWPVPDAAYTLYVPWAAPFTSWPAGIALIGVTLAGAGSLSLGLRSGGYGYTGAPALAFVGGGGSLGAATAYVAAARMTSLTLTNAGAGYTAAPVITVAGDDGTDGELNIPADLLREALLWGGTAVLQYPDLKRRFGTVNWQRYETFVAQRAGQGPALVHNLRRR